MEGADLKEDLRNLQRQLADYAMVTDLLSKMAELRAESIIVDKIFDLFSMLCAPSVISYLPLIGDKPGNVISRSATHVDSEKIKSCMMDLKEDYLWTDSGRGFILRISHDDKKIGIFELAGFAFHEYREHYLNVAIQLTKVLGLAISNARTYQLLEDEIVKHKLAKEALLDSEDRFSTLVENSPECIYTLSVDGIITSLNPAFEDITGWPRDEWVGKHFKGIAHPDDLPVAVKWFQQVLHGEKTPLHELRILSKSGGYIIAEFITAPVIKDGKVVGASGITRNITERKRMEAALRESEEKFRTLSDKSPNIIFINKKGRVIYVSDRSVEIMGYKKEEICASEFNFFTLIAPESVDLARANHNKHQAGEDVPSCEYSLITKEGKKIEVIIATKLIKYEGEPAILGIITDITERKKAEEEMALLNKELSEKIENLGRFHRLTVGREFEMIRLKAEVNALLEKAGQPKKYEAPDKVKED